MRINIKVISNARKETITQEANRYKVYLTVPPVDGKANKKLIEVLANYFDVKKKQVKIIRGEKNKNKVVEVNNES